MCIVGGLRTFVMPAVHLSLARIAREWKADVFAHVHDFSDFRADPIQYVERGNRTCGRDPLPHLLEMSPVHVEINSRVTECPNTAAVQYSQIRECIRTALAHRRYELLLRVRPDYYFAPSFDPASLPTHPGSVSQAWAIAGFNMDCLFVLNLAAAEEFIRTPFSMTGQTLEWPTCGGGNNLDTEHPLFREALPKDALFGRPLKVPWQTRISNNITRVWGGLVRSPRVLRVPTDISWARLKTELEAHRDQFRCTKGGAADPRPFRVYNHPFGNNGKGDLT